MFSLQAHQLLCGDDAYSKPFQVEQQSLFDICYKVMQLHVSFHTDVRARGLVSGLGLLF